MTQMMRGDAGMGEQRAGSGPGDVTRREVPRFTLTICAICVICGLIHFVFIRVHSWFRVPQEEA